MVDAVKMQRYLRATAGSLALLAIVFYAMAVVVQEGQTALITRFGRPVRAEHDSGPPLEASLADRSDLLARHAAARL